ncbi:MAG: hypothetical protein QOE14_2289 [Humisphaera sp.]|nr:hypothetical protein [Humisphaera sp.]
MSVVILCAAILMSQETKGADAATTENAAATAGSDGAGGEVAPAAPARGCSIWRLIWVMVVCGLIGGVINLLLAWEDEEKIATPSVPPVSPAGATQFWKESRWWRLLLRHLLVATVASFLVPLFLNTISSNLIKEARCDVLELLVFAGFCLIAALSASRFIQTLTDRVVELAKDAKKEAAKAKATAQAAEEKVEDLEEDRTEPEPAAKTSDAAMAMRAMKPADEATVKILQALNNPRWIYRTATGIAKDANLDRAVVMSKLDQMMRDGLVANVPSRKTGADRWKLTAAGRTAIA